MLKGLSEKEVIFNRKKYGTNKISTKKKDSILKLFLSTLGDPIIKILLIALAIKTIFLFKEFNWFETIGIVLSILVASLISSISEYGSEIAFENLENEASKIKCKVKRENILQEIDINDIVVNDLIFLEAGDKIPADGYIIEGSCHIDESSITGEAIEVLKTKNDKLLRGTIVLEDEAYMLVTETGDNTYFGKMNKDLQEKNPDSPLKLRLSHLAKIISKIGYISAILVSISFLFYKIVIINNFNINNILMDIKNFPLILKYILQALTMSVTIIVVAVPEGLPMMITLVLSSNIKKMIKNNVLVRKMTGIETAGNINILFTDKTGTITNGKLEVINYISPNLKPYKNIEDILDKSLYNHVHNNCLYNNSSTYNKNITGGNITDKAILKYIKDHNKIHKIVNKNTFKSINKYSAVTLDNNITYYKGSYEKLLPNCNTYIENDKIRPLINKDEIIKKITSVEKQGIRVIMLALSKYDDLSDLTFLGFICIKDEIRKEAKNAIEMIKNAGVDIVMITGDNIETAKTIAKDINLITNSKDLALTGDEIRKMSDEKLKKILKNIKVIARALPDDKNRLVKIAQELDLVVGMTGDGINDATALKRADVGFAIGSGTEVAKEASDIIILDDNLISIAKAILYGRTIFKSIRKFIIFQLTINFCAVSLSIIGPFIKVPTPVTVTQMLWVNMIMDTLAGVAFSYEPALYEYMNEAPKKKNEHIINSYMYKEIIISGLYSFLVLILFLKSKSIHNIYESNKTLMTAFFTLFIFMSIINSFCARTNRINILKNITKNKVFIPFIILIILVQLYIIYFGGVMFRSFGLSPKHLLITILISLTIIPIDTIRKIILNKKHQNTGV